MDENGMLSIEDVRVIVLSSGNIVIGFLHYPTHEEELENPELAGNVILQEFYEIEYEANEEDEDAAGTPTFQVLAMRWLPFILDNALLLQKHNIIGTGKPDEDLLRMYADLLSGADSDDEFEVDDGSEN